MTDVETARLQSSTKRLPRMLLARALRRRRSQPLTARALSALALAGIALAALLPAYASSNHLLLGGRALIVGLFALSLNLLVGTTGLVSFGHAAYFGFGAYAVAILATRHGLPVLVCLALAPLVGAAVAFVCGLVVLRGRELYFSLLTLGIAQLVWAVAQRWDSFTGSDTGITGVFPPAWIASVRGTYWFVLGVVAGCAVLLLVVTRSPFGDALRAIRENRLRAEFTGIPVRRYELAAFVLAGVVAAVAGGLSAIWNSSATLSDIDWQNSALPMIVALLGGVFSYFLGPLVGAFFYVFVENYALQRTSYFHLGVGVAVLVVALAAPGGLIGGVGRLIDLVVSLSGRPSRRRLSPPEAAAPVSEAAPWPAAAVEPSPAAASAPPPGSILAVEHLSKAFGGVQAVDDVTFSVREGAIHAIIGPNGAGKSTLFNLISGLLPPDAGRVAFRGEDVTAADPPTLVTRGIGRSFQQTNVFWALSARDNIVVADAAARGETWRMFGGHAEDRYERSDALLERVSLASVRDSPAIELSHGDQRSLEIATTLAVGSQLLLLDEPTAGLSPLETRQAVGLITRLAREQGLTVLFVEHDMEVVFGVADWITVLHRGSVLADGPPETIRADEAVKEAYLGAGELERIPR